MTRAEFLNRGGLWVMAQIPLMLTAFFLPVWLGPGQLLPRDPLAMAGAGITLAGAALTIWSLMSLGNALSSFPGPLPDTRLQRQRAYRWMRHPMYAGVMLASIGWALWWLSGAGTAYALALAVFFDRKAAYEEKRLREKYRDYPDYARTVKKFIPGVY